MSKVLVRGVFAAAVLALPVQLAVREVASEPYPGLYQPSFGGEVAEGPTYQTSEPRVTVSEGGGRSHEVAYDAVLPVTGVLPQAAFRSAFDDAARAQAPQTRAWLRQRLLDLEPGSDPRFVRVEWLTVDRRLDSSTATVTGVRDTTEIDVREQR